MQLLNTDKFYELYKRDVTVLDTRSPEQIWEGIIKNALVVPYASDFLHELQNVLSDGEILLLADEDKVAEVTNMLRGTGAYQIAGIMNGGFAAWHSSGYPIDILIGIDADEFAMDYHYDEFVLLDVRSAEEFRQQHIEYAAHIALGDLENMLCDMDANQLYYVFAGNVANTLTAGSLFKRAGFERVRLVKATLDEIKQQQVPVVTSKKQTQPPEKSSE